MKKVLITGGAGGIGSAAAWTLAEAGYDIIINYFENEEAASELVRELHSAGYAAEAVRADVGKAEEVAAMFAQIDSLDVLINNAGIAYYGLLCDMSEKDWDRIFDTNIKGAFLCSRAAIPYFLRQQRGSIINISSMWGSRGASCEVAYSAAKAALHGFTKALAKELGLSGIRVNCIAPGVIDTPMNERVGEDIMQEMADNTPLGRIGRPCDIANMISFLTDEERAAFITGQVFTVDGGYAI